MSFPKTASTKTHTFNLSLGLALGLSLGFSTVAIGDDLKLEEVVVHGKYLSIDKVDSVKTPTPILDIPQSLSVLTNVQIEQQAFRSIGDILRYTPGLSISQGEGHRDAIIIRGIETTADFFIDGVRDDVQYYRPLYNVQQVEVLRGSNALLFGRGGGGGIINRVQKQAEFGDSYAQLSASANTFEGYSAAIDSNFGSRDNMAFRINGYFESLENHRDYYEGDSFAINPTFSFNAGDNTKLTISYEYVDDDRVVDRGVPSQNVAGGPGVPLKDFEETFFGAADDNVTTLQAHLLRSRVDHDFNDQLRGNVTLQYADYDKFYQNLYASEEVTITNGIFPEVELDGYNDTTDRQNLILQANLIAEFDTGELHHTLLVGIEAGQQETSNARFDNVFAANNDDQLFIPFTDPLVVPDFAFSDLARDRASDVTFNSVYLQNQIDLTGNLKFLLGLRYDEFDIKVFDTIEANDGDNVNGRFERKDSEVTPRYGLIYKPAANFSVYASHSETFLPRSGDQFLTLNLDSESTRPQSFVNREIGVKWDFRDSMSFTFAAFQLERESYTSVDPEDNAQLIVIDGSLTKGYELQLSGGLTDYWSISAGYSNLSGKVERTDGTGNDGNRTRQTPDHMFSIWNSFDVNEKIKFGLGATYQDGFFVSEDNSVEVPDYVRVDAAAYYQMNADLRLQLNVENLLGETYFPDAHSNNNISTGAPLNARFSVIYNL
ncbi:MAG: catecholate siderophore receptor [Candidatus Azotimanducaceae bacterium]|jgi:catecholate siderophore receptor